MADAGGAFYQLHLLLDKHAGEQIGLVDSIAERVQTLGGVAVGDPRHVAEAHADFAGPERLRGGAGDAPGSWKRTELILTDAHDRRRGLPNRATTARTT